MNPLRILLLIIVGVGVITLMNSAFVVTETNQGMVLSLGKISRLEAEPGLKFRIPFYQQVKFFDKRILETDSQAEEIQSRDKKRIVVDTFTRWRITDAKKFYETMRTESSARDRLNIIVNSSTRRVLARETLQNVVSGNRAELVGEILNESYREALPFGIEVVDVRIKRADLPQANSNAVFKRMRAEREKEAKEIRAQGAEEAQKIRASAERERTILLAEAQRDAEKLRGEGDAESIRITAKAFSAEPDFYNFYRSLEAYRTSLVGEDTLLVLDPAVDFFKYFNTRLRGK